MKIKDIFSDRKNLKISSKCFDISEIYISGIYENSKFVKKDSIFMAFTGDNFDGNKFIPDAFKNGACITVTDNENIFNQYKNIYPIILTNDFYTTTLKITNLFFKFPADRLKIIGITGTNGKTTVSYLLKHIFSSFGIKCGLIGTNGSYIRDKFYQNSLTTPKLIELQYILSKMVESGVEYCFMEVSSHSLMLGRVDHISFFASVFTNLTQDHLDFHNNMENYFLAKKKLFSITSGIKITNNDDEWGKKLKNSFDNMLSYSIHNDSDYRAIDIENSMENTNYTLIDRKNSEYSVKMNLLGNFNVYNSLAAISLAREVTKQDLKKIVNKVNSFTAVKGRFEKIFDKDKGILIIVDYAHTPDGLENVLTSAKEFCNGRLITLFGCGGQRDRTKRPIMGKIAQNFSDYIIITSDNPRKENPDKIIDDILTGIDNKKKDFFIEPDRNLAIKYGIDMLKKDDVLILAGKGHETYQILHDKTIDFNDEKIARDYLISKK